jgi:hypothetical protein
LSRTFAIFILSGGIDEAATKQMSLAEYEAAENLMNLVSAGTLSWYPAEPVPGWEK